MSSAGINPLAIYDPQMYAQQLAIQRRQALAQSLLGAGENGSGSTPYAGLANAGKQVLGAFLAKRSDQQMGNLYNPQPQPGGVDTGQISNTPGSAPSAQTPPAPGQTAPTTPPVPAAPQQPQPQASNQPPDYATLNPMMKRVYDSIPHVPGITAQQSVMAYLDPSTRAAYMTAAYQGAAPTPDMKNAAFANPGDPTAQQQAVNGVVQKAGSIEVRPEGYIRLPNGQIVYGPNESSNTYYTTGPNNEPIGHQIEGGASAAASTAGTVEYAKEQNKIIDVKLADGRTVPMRAGDAVQFGLAPPSNSSPTPTPASPASPTSAPPPNITAQNPLNVQQGGRDIRYSTPTAGLGKAWDTLGQYGQRGINTVSAIVKTWAPNAPPQYAANVAQTLKVDPNQPLNLADPNVRGSLMDAMRPNETGSTYAPPAAPNAAPRPQIGQSTAQAKVQEATGEAATGLAHAQAVTQSTLKAIDGLIALNDQVPDSTWISPDWKADINKRAPALFKGNAGALAQWNQLNGIGVLGGLKQLQGLGRLDLPEVNQVVKTNGVPADVPRAQRLQILQNLKTMVQNNLAATQNNVANLNQPGLGTSQQQAPMGNYGAPNPQDIVNELRRRGVVK